MVACAVEYIDTQIQAERCNFSQRCTSWRAHSRTEMFFSYTLYSLDALTSVVRKDDNDWVKHCMTWEAEGIRQRRRPTKTWWDCVKDDMESLRLSQKYAQFRNKW